jgi:DNA-binding transcriptional LysR family regulator
MSDIDLNAVAVFAGVLEAGTFRGAALALRVPRSTISRKIAELEDRLGVRLLERTTRSVRLTDEGAAYHRHVLPALEALREAERAASTGRAAPSGRLRITAPDGFGRSSFAEALAEYMRLYPAVELDVELTNRRVDLVAEGFDLAIRAGWLADSTLVSRRLGRAQPVRLHASPAYLRARGTPRRLKDLAEHDCLVLTGAPRTWPLRRSGRVAEVPLRVRAAASSFELLLELALAGQGIARLPEHMGVAAVRSGALRTVLDAAAPPPLPLHIVYPSARHLSVKVRKLIELLEARSAEFPELGG